MNNHLMRILAVVLAVCYVVPGVGAASEIKPVVRPGALSGAGETSPVLFGTFKANDSFQVQMNLSAESQEMLSNITWLPRSFEVVSVEDDRAAEALVTFDSPRPSGNPINDRVVMEWYAARNHEGKIIEAPAMLVLHILDGKMRVARLIARSFSFQGIHAFVMHLPYYGLRRSGKQGKDPENVLNRIQQGISDARRGRDAIASLPYVQHGSIGIQGTSLGSFVTSVAAGMDRAFDPVFMILGGADIHGILRSAMGEAQDIREALEKNGYTNEKIKRLAWKIEPSRLAHRLNPNRTWLFSAKDDQVVPAANARVLAKAAHLTPAHHIWLSGNHYTCAIHLPRLITQMVQIIKAPLPGSTAVGSTVSD